MKKTIEIHLVRLTEVCGKVLSEKYAYKSIKTALLLSNVIDAVTTVPLAVGYGALNLSVRSLDR